MGSSPDPQWNWDMGLPSEVWMPLGGGQQRKARQVPGGIGMQEAYVRNDKVTPSCSVSHSYEGGKLFFLTQSEGK